MNDFELEAKLRAVRVPARDEEYWKDFSRRVRTQLGRSAVVEPLPTRLLPQWARNSGLALAGVTFCLLLCPIFQAALQDEQMWQRDAAKLPKQLHVLMADEHGMQYLVSERD
jgi:hypothetical protein